MGEFLEFSYEDFRYKLYIPNSYASDKEFPLMVMLHGCDQNPDDFAAGTMMNELAEKENFLALYPDMNHLFNPRNPDGYNPFGCWNWFLDKNQHRGKGHPKLINGIIEEVKASYKIDSNKIYAAGLSAGASLACILGVTYPDVFSGIGIFAGLAYDAANVVFLTDPLGEAAKKSMQQGVPDPYECGNSAFIEMGEHKRRMPVIVFHGICDTVVHPKNGHQVIIQWAQTNFLVDGGTGKADVKPLHVESNIINEKSYTQHVYGDNSDEPFMELWMIDELGHKWSGGNPEGSYTDPLGPNATEIIWNFFKKQQNKEDSDAETTSVDSPGEALIFEATEFPIEAFGGLIEETPVNSIEEASGETRVEADASVLPTQGEETNATDVETTAEPIKQAAPKKSFIRSFFLKFLKKRR